MRSFTKALVAATCLFASAAVAQQVDPIIIKGSKFFYKTNGTQFFIKGIAYQQDFTGTTSVPGQDNSGGFNDPLANGDGCKRDIPYLKELQTNTVRVYALDPTLDHDDCMNQMAAAGIYVIADLSAPNNADSINRDDPEWNDDLYARYASVIDVMQKYTNTLGFFAGNEVTNAPNNTNAAPFVKAAVRDMKAYISQKGYRTIGVGYATSDNEYIREQIADYFNCGDQTDAIDFWGYNIYSWCGDSSYVESGYNLRTEEFASYSVPSFFAEYGCNTVEPRPFTEVLALYGPQMSKVFSGGIVYMYFQEANNYGVVSIGSNNQATTLTDFNMLSTQIAKVSPSATNINDYTPTNSPAACPTEFVNWTSVATPLPPTPNEELCSCMYSSLSCVVNSGTNPTKYEDLFNYVCGRDNSACNGIAHVAHTGTYGAYSMCNSTQQLGWVFDQYYKGQKSASTACDFNGNAHTQSGGSSSQCKALLNQAGSAGTGTVTSSPTGTGAGAAGGATSKAAANINAVPRPETSILPMGFILALAAVFGMAMILL